MANDAATLYELVIAAIGALIVWALRVVIVVVVLRLMGVDL